MSKIYSRKRFILKPIYKKHDGGKTPKRTFIITGKYLKVILILIIIIITYQMLLSYIEPVFESLCEQKVKSVATIISNQESFQFFCDFAHYLNNDLSNANLIMCDELEKIIEKTTEYGISTEDFLFMIENSKTEISMLDCYHWVKYIPEICNNVRYVN